MLMFALLMLCISSVLGIVLKALIASIRARSVRCAGLAAFRASSMCSLRVVRRVSFGLQALEPCLEGKRWKSVVVLVRTSLSRILRELQFKVISLSVI